MIKHRITPIFTTLPKITSYPMLINLYLICCVIITIATYSQQVTMVTTCVYHCSSTQVAIPERERGGGGVDLH